MENPERHLALAGAGKTQPLRRRRRRVSQWDVLRAARAFYGGSLGVDEIQKVKAAYPLNGRVARQPRVLL